MDEILFDKINNNHLMIIVKPNSSKTKVIGYDKSRNAVKISVAAPPDNGKANKELTKFLKKVLNKKIVVDDIIIKSGETSRLKLVQIITD